MHLSKSSPYSPEVYFTKTPGSHPSFPQSTATCCPSVNFIFPLLSVLNILYSSPPSLFASGLIQAFSGYTIFFSRSNQGIGISSRAILSRILRKYQALFVLPARVLALKVLIPFQVHQVFV